jgi:hypothetical protein
MKEDDNVGHLLVACAGEIRDAKKILFGKPERKRPLGGHRRRWDDNNGLDIREIGWEGVHWI